MPNCSELLRHIVLGMAQAHVDFEAMELLETRRFHSKMSSFGTGKFRKHVASLGMQHLNRYINALHFRKCTVLFL